MVDGGSLEVGAVFFSAHNGGRAADLKMSTHSVGESEKKRGIRIKRIKNSISIKFTFRFQSFKVRDG
jgi:hypothetical protein